MNNDKPTFFQRFYDQHPGTCMFVALAAAYGFVSFCRWLDQFVK